jgi:hypothetical protein
MLVLARSTCLLIFAVQDHIPKCSELFYDLSIQVESSRSSYISSLELIYFAA